MVAGGSGVAGSQWWASQQWHPASEVGNQKAWLFATASDNLRRGDQTLKVRMIGEKLGRLMFDVQDGSIRFPIFTARRKNKNAHNQPVFRHHDSAVLR